MSLVGTVTHVAAGDFGEGVRRTITLGAGVLVGAQAGAWLSQGIHGRSIMRSNYTQERSGFHRGPPPGAQAMVRLAPATAAVAGRSARR